MILRWLAPGTALLAASCAPSHPQTSDGARPHPTIVSLNPCSDAILAEVADPRQILAISHYSHDPRATSMDLVAARNFPATGGTVEEVLALDPDVVVVGSFIAPAAKNAFQRLGMKVETIGIAGSVDDSMAQVRALARLSGHAAAGEALVARIAAARAASAPPPGTPAVSAVVWQAGGIVPGTGALISNLLRDAGFTSHSAARGLGQADRLPLEAMLADPPRVILVAGAGGGEDRLLAHPALASLRHTARVRFDPSLLYCGGPTIPRALARLAQVRSGLQR